MSGTRRERFEAALTHWVEAAGAANQAELDYVLAKATAQTEAGESSKLKNQMARDAYVVGQTIPERQTRLQTKTAERAAYHRLVFERSGSPDAADAELARHDDEGAED